jgi:vacuolar-type H+-ATPase subunit I/STV1
LLRPVSMKRFSITTPMEYEDQIIEGLGRLGVTQLIKEHSFNEEKKAANIEICDRYLSLEQRLNSIPHNSSIAEQKKLRNKFSLKGLFGVPPQKKIESSETIFKLSDVDLKTKELEPKMDELFTKTEDLREEIVRLRSLEERLTILDKNGIRVDEVDDFKYIFVKAGLINRDFHLKLERYLKDADLTYVVKSYSHKEDFVVISGAVSYKPYIEEALALLNFHDFKFDELKDPESQLPLVDIRSMLEDKESKMEDFIEEANKLRTEINPFKETISEALKIEDVRSTIAKIGKNALIQGWVPTDKIGLLQEAISNASDKTAYINLENPRTEDNVPTQLSNPSIFKSFELFTRLAGTPNYFEIDPTPIFTIFYVIMFGMMFGDIGGGLVFIVLGLLLSRVYKNILGIRASAVRNLGKVFFICGISTIIFGAFYGEFFLIEAFHPFLLSPLKDQNEIMAIALIFGVAQIMLGLILSVYNKLRTGHKLEALLSERGLLGLAYYSVGVVLAIKFIAAGMNLNAFMDNIFLTYVALGLLGLIFVAPVIIGLIEGEGNIIQKLLIGFTGFFEALIAFLANSISYIRLAALAIAHGAFALSAALLAGVIGGLPSYLLINIIVIIIEGMSVTIQSMRLMYYEFFTKFYSGTGKPYRPFRLKVIDKAMNKDKKQTII